MSNVAVSALMMELGEELAPLLRFVTESRFAERQGDPQICDFVFGNPHDLALPGIGDALARWAEPKDKDWFAYKMNEEPAREAVASSLRWIVDHKVEPEDVFLTSGAFGALSVALRAVVDPGDEVIFLSPPWFFYGPMIRVAGATPVRVTLSPPFDLDFDAIAAAITPKTRAIIVNTPHNPTGHMYGRAALDGLATVLTEASERNGRPIYLLSDEAYRRIVYEGNEHVSPAAAYAETLVLYTYGKTLLAPGERLGYIALPPTMAGRESMRDALFLSQIAGGWQFPNATLQYALPELEELSIDVEQLQRRRDRLVGALASFGYEVLVPDGTFYVMVRCPSEDEWGFVDRLAEHDVFVGPGEIFELPGWFRLSLTANDAMIERALPVFEAAIS